MKMHGKTNVKSKIRVDLLPAMYMFLQKLQGYEVLSFGENFRILFYLIMLGTGSAKLKKKPWEAYELKVCT